MQDVIFFIQHNLLLFGAWLGVIILLIIVEIKERFWGPLPLTASQLTMSLNSGNAVLLDLRPHAEYSKGHITGAQSFISSEINDSAVLLKRLESMRGGDQQRPVILTCKDGIKSKQEAFKLKSKGLLNVSYLQGGMSTWQAEGLPLITN